MRIGLLDSGVGEGVAAQRRFWQGALCVEAGEATRPVADHALVIASLVREMGPDSVELLDAQIFDRVLHCPAPVAAAGLDWLVENGAIVVNVSWGLATEHEALRSACSRAVAAGVWLVAATPIRGAAPAPARYPGVVSATGDARCAPGELSFFDGPPADFGACPAPHAVAGAQAARRGGSSFACARVCGALAKALEADPSCDPRIALQRGAAHRGPQTRPVRPRREDD